MSVKYLSSKPFRICCYEQAYEKVIRIIRHFGFAERQLKNNSRILVTGRRKLSQLNRMFAVFPSNRERFA